ncbi:MAG: SurA N-terminal domain-containing protein [Chloroflexi bacterium]|nr:SurA N-terminal domain-containing protein [Chloroflexota bacterium]MDA1226597.1 SurA N-terminal domain-containing protein [Chloroflexota bacterium]
MTQPNPARPDRRSEVVRIQQLKRRRRYAFAIIGALMLVIVGILLAGYVIIFVRPPQQLVVRVNDIEYSRGDMVKILRVRQRSLEQTGERLDNSTDVFQALQLIVENEIIAQTAPSLGITVSEEEVDAQINFSITLSSGVDPFGKSPDQLEREFDEQYGRFLNESQINEKEHRDIVRRIILRQKVRIFVGESVPLVAKQYHVYRLTLQSGDEADVMRTKYQDMVRTNTDPQILAEAFKNITREFSREPAESLRIGGDLGWLPLGIIKDYDDVIATLEMGRLSDPVRNRDVQNDTLIFMVSEVDELRDVHPGHVETLRNNALDDWINEHRRDHEVYAVFNSEIYAWIIEQLGISTSILPTPVPDDPYQQLFKDQGLISAP